jgi:uncharacterized protein YjdB
VLLVFPGGSILIQESNLKRSIALILSLIVVFVSAAVMAPAQSFASSATGTKQLKVAAGKVVSPAAKVVKYKKQKSGKINVKSGLINVRSGAGTGYKILGTLKKSEKITITGEKSSWYKIKFKGKTGYVSKTYVKIVPGTLVTSVKYSNINNTRTLIIGEKFTILAKIEPSKAKDKSLKWKSSDKAVATVSKNGVVTAKAEGTAVISATSADGSKKTASASIVVGTKVEALAFANVADTHTLIKGETKKITVGVEPFEASNKAVTWSSSSASVATVSSSGKVTAKKAGTATITATAQDGSGKKVTCKVTVGTKVSKVTVSGETVYVKGQSTLLTSTVTPSGASNKKLLWTSSDINVAKVSSAGKVTYVGDGKAVITATAQDGTNISGSLDVACYSFTVNSTKFIAHRGLSAIEPENTIPAFEAACKAGVWGVECDIWESKADTGGDDSDDTGDDGGGNGDDDGDGAITSASVSALDGAPGAYNRELIVSHDRSLLRMTGVNKTVTGLTLSAIKEFPVTSGNNIGKYQGAKALYTPTLEEYLKVLKKYDGLNYVNGVKSSRVNAVIEIKRTTGDNPIEISDEGVARMLDLIVENGMEERTTVISFSTVALEKVIDQSKARSLPIKTMYLVSSGTDAITVETEVYEASILGASHKGVNSIGLASGLLKDVELSNLIKGYGMEINVWTVDDPLKAMKFIQNLKTDYITTNVKLF